MDTLTLKAIPSSILLEYFLVELSTETDQDMMNLLLLYMHEKRSFPAKLLLEKPYSKFESNFVITEASSIFHTPLWRFMFMNLTQPGFHLLN